MKIIAAIRRTWDAIDHETEEILEKPVFVGCVVLFRGQDANPDIDVSLSRSEGHCILTAPKLHEHDGHAPPWVAEGGEHRNIAGMPAYITRVLQSVIDQAKVKKAPKIEVSELSETGELQGKTEVFENLTQASEKASAAEKHSAVVLSFN